MRKVFALLLAVVVLFALVSCSVEMQELPASYFVRSAEATVWKETVSSEADTEGEGITVDGLENGTSPARLTKLTMTLDPSDLVGYQILYCDFELTANTDAELTLEPVVRIGEDGEARRQGKTDYKLVAGESTEISLAVEIAINRANEEITVEILFTSTLPFASEAEGGEESEAAEAIDLVSWAAITYEISGMRFYGAQTTAT